MSDKKYPFPLVRDYLYLLAIGVSINVFTLIHVFSEDPITAAELDKKLNFAATVTSIILAVIAIIISLVESSRSSTSNEKIMASSEKIELETKKIEDATQVINESVDALGNLSETLAKLDIEDQITKVISRVEVLDKEFKQILKDSNKELKEELSLTFSSSNEMDAKVKSYDSKLDSKLDASELWESYNLVQTIDHKKILCFIFFASDKKINMYSSIQSYAESLFPSIFFAGLYVGIFRSLVKFNLIDFTTEEGKITYELNEHLEELARDYIKEGISLEGMEDYLKE